MGEVQPDTAQERWRCAGVDDFIRAEVPVSNPWTGRLIESGGRSAPADEATPKGAS
jgi:hypothetical protein